MALNGYAGSPSITDCLGKQACRGGLAPHVCKLRHCLHVFAGLGPVNARVHVTNTIDAEIIIGTVIIIAQDEHSSNQFPFNSSTICKLEALSRSNSVPLPCAALHCCACPASM